MTNLPMLTHPMKTSEFDYDLPPELIAQEPVSPRDASRLMVLERATRTISHHTFRDLMTFLRPGDIVVANNTRVIPARLHGRKPTGGSVELLLLERHSATEWQAMVGGRRVRRGVTITIDDPDGNSTALTATIIGEGDESLRELRFSEPVESWLERVGSTPLPPYIHTTLDDPERYQTIYARPPGSAAAPTAGLHFTPELLLALREQGVLFETCTLHVGLDTFKPVAVDLISDHTIHSEWATLTPEAARRINEAKLAGGRLIAVGTTSMRVLETAALRSAGISGTLQTISQRDASGETSGLCPWKPVAAFEGHTDLYISPGYVFRAVDGLITNFHLPRSSLLMLVSAFAGHTFSRQAYKAAIEATYRFYSFGDAMFII